jgi:hypothetical protein
VILVWVVAVSQPYPNLKVKSRRNLANYIDFIEI